MRRDARRDTLARFDRDGEGGAERRLVALSHRMQAELVAALAREAEADQPARVRRHEVDRVRRRELRCDHEIALVLAIGIIDDDDEASGADLLDRLFDRRERRLRRGRRHAEDRIRPAMRRSTYFASTSTSRFSSSPTAIVPSVVSESV